MESRENQQLLTIPEEKALVEWIRRLTITGHPATHTFIREMAEELRQRRVSQINDEMDLVCYLPITILAACKERESGKQKILKGRRMITTEDVVKALEETEAATKDKTKRRKQRKRKRIESDEGESSDVEGNHSDEEGPLEPREEELLDCIVVERR